MTALIITEQPMLTDNANIARLVTAAKHCHDQVMIVVLGTLAETEINISGVTKVVCLNLEELVAETIASAIKMFLAQEAGVTHLLFDDGTFGKNVMPRLAAMVDAEPVSSVIEIHANNEFSRPIYAGNAIERVQIEAGLIALTIRVNRFAAIEAGSTVTPVTNAELELPAAKVKLISTEQHQSDRPELASANVVVSGGRGLQSKAQFVLVEQLADVLGAAVGASRAAVDAGFVPNDYQVGQTGKVVAPNLYIALGISGAIQHVAGIKDSKVIVAINQDPEAPIFEVADYGLVGDVFELVPELILQLKTQTNGG